MKLGSAGLLAALFLLLTPKLRGEPLVTNVGLGTFFHPVEEPETLRLPPCYDQGPCRCRKERVYIFGVNGFNPLCVGNFNGLLSYFRKQGFENTYFGQLYTSHWFADKAREIRKKDPEARIALVGFSLGANYVRGIANSLARDGIKVDLVVYLVGDYVKNTKDSFPANVARVVNVRAKGIVLTGGDLFFNGADIDGAVNRHLTCRHILTPSRRETLELMMHELLTLACFPDPSAAPIAPAWAPARAVGPIRGALR
jgi:hypothetical protein